MDVINWILVGLFLLTLVFVLVQDLRRSDKPTRFYYWKSWSNDMLRILVLAVLSTFICTCLILFTVSMADLLVEYDPSPSWVSAAMITSTLLVFLWGWFFIIVKINKSDFVRFTPKELDYRELKRAQTRQLVWKYIRLPIKTFCRKLFRIKEEPLA